MSRDGDHALARAHSIYNNASSYRRKLERRAGIAGRGSAERQQVEVRLAAAVMDVGSAHTPERISAAAGRAQRLAQSLIAANKLPAAREVEQEKAAALARVREEIKR